jgi:ABC-type methionine transport system ATPase subunit
MSINQLAKNSFNTSEINLENSQVAAQEFIKTRIRVRIPKHYRQEPVISHLVSHYGLSINIVAALLGANAIDDGWFDLELTGTSEQLRNAQIYINDLDLEVLSESDSQEFCW